MAMSIREMINSFSFGSFVYTYYDYVAKFHVVPEKWQDLFEYMEFAKIESKIEKYVQSFQPKQR